MQLAASVHFHICIKKQQKQTIKKPNKQTKKLNINKNNPKTNKNIKKTSMTKCKNKKPKKTI